jgi:hypothetical protein
MTEREQFEAWWLKRTGLMQMHNPEAWDAWCAWQARAASQPAQESVACGYEACDCRGYCKKQQAEPKLFAYGTHPTQVVKLQQAEPVAWQVRSISRVSKERGDWRFVDSKDKPSVNSPVDCEFRPLYAAPTAAQQAEPTLFNVVVDESIPTNTLFVTQGSKVVGVITGISAASQPMFHDLKGMRVQERMQPEAVGLLREARECAGPMLRKRIDAYLAKVGK